MKKKNDAGIENGRNKLTNKEHINQVDVDEREESVVEYLRG